MQTLFNFFHLTENLYQVPMFRFSNLNLMAMKSYWSVIECLIFKSVQCYFHSSLMKMPITFFFFYQNKIKYTEIFYI